ncbi:hypothetical protein OH76DRAFT_1483471 [Lentinus brumalis]|uniref:DUF6533 domain-containing protein n=1 Tax=Lentinus brumalis TaxID=2498619 RepID=A0A371D8X2_9APHY|nr:hypothetical protein OH76DRAFT_1483471 [Polyporus brumalis]
MSSDVGADAASVVAVFDSVYTELHCQIAASVLFIYDTFITFDREVACFWTVKRSGASLLFFANKLISMTYFVMMVVATFASFPSDKRSVHSLTQICVLHAHTDFYSCSSFTIADYTIEILQFVPGAGFSALRAYVLSKSKLLGLLIFALSLAPVAVNLVKYGYQLSGENFPPFGCLGVDAETLTMSIRLARTIYFIVIFILNILHLVLTVTTLAGIQTSGTSYVTTFTAPFTSIIVSRFLLDLQDVNQAVVRIDPDDPLHSSRDPYDVPSFITSLGASINPAISARSDEESEGNDSARSRSNRDENVEASAAALASSSM